MRLRLSVLAASLAVCLLVPPAGAEPMAYLGRIEDLPLPPGLQERPEAGHAFDTPAGRIVEAMAEGPLTAEQVMAFYATTLPELGWVEHGPMAFKRENEVLRLNLTPSNGRLRVQFALQPDH